MKEELITEIIQKMLPYLDNAQLKQLRTVMGQTFFHFEVIDAEIMPDENDSNDLATEGKLHDLFLRIFPHPKADISHLAKELSQKKGLFIVHPK